MSEQNLAKMLTVHGYVAILLTYMLTTDTSAQKCT
jgi:hypothetical protein